MAALTHLAAEPGHAVPAPAADDPLGWWEDKQVAVAVRANTIRGWVATSRSHPIRRSDDVGTMTIVLLIVNQTLASRYPAEVTVAVRVGGPHGDPDHVLGLWDERDVYDVRRPRALRHRRD